MCEKGSDPMLRATCMPVLTLCRAIWEGWVPRHVVRDGLLGAADVSLWTQVVGPFGACRLSLARVGWTVGSPFEWTTHDGT
eukprot:8446790-Pyramimonas_sp.AAC.1